MTTHAAPLYLLQTKFGDLQVAVVIVAGRALLLVGAIGASVRAQAPAAPALASQVEVLRTAHGVPHIRAANLKAAAYALAYVQLEDYGPRVAFALVRARGEMGKWFGRDSIEGDYPARLAHAEAV